MFGEEPNDAQAAIDCLLDQLNIRLQKDPTLNFDYDYDQLICYGELLSTTIISHFLNHSNLPARWLGYQTILEIGQYMEGSQSGLGTLHPPGK